MPGRHRTPRKSLGQRIASLFKPAHSTPEQVSAERPDAKELLKTLSA